MSMNIEAVEILKKILEAQNQLYGKEIEIVTKKILAVQKDDIELLIAETEEERELISKIATLEENRIKLIERLGYKKLTELLESIKEESLRKNLLKLREELLEKLEKLKEKNEILKELISITNSVIDYTIKEMTGLRDVGYNQDRKKSRQTETNILNRKG